VYYTKELIPNGMKKIATSEKVNTVKFTKETEENQILESLNFKSLQKKLESIPEWKKIKSAYPVTPLVTLILIAVLCGVTNSSDATRWIGGLTPEQLANYGLIKAPSNPTVWRCLVAVPHKTLSDILISWIKENRLEHKISRLQFIFDGKHLKTASKKEEKSKVMIANIIEAVGKGIIFQEVIDVKTNEIPVLQQAMEEEVIPPGSDVTGDAIHMQKETVEIAKKKTYVSLA
jgi:hypothetical protein